MFWNKKSTGIDIDERVDHNEEFDRIDEYYTEIAKLDNFIEIIHANHYYPSFRWSDRGVIRRYASVVKQNTENKKLNEEMNAVLNGNKEWYGHAQETFKKTKQQVEDLKLHLELEKNNFLELYKKNRGLESEVYLLKRELEASRLRGRGWNNELKND